MMHTVKTGNMLTNLKHTNNDINRKTGMIPEDSAEQEELIGPRPMVISVAILLEMKKNFLIFSNLCSDHGMEATGGILQASKVTIIMRNYT